jgi:nucleoside-diphosphate-sugar epimerase
LKIGLFVSKIQTDDLEHIFTHTSDLWTNISSSRIFFTGATGVFGIWILEAMMWARKKMGLSFEVVVLSRSPKNFLAQCPQFSNQDFIQFYTGDINDFTFPAPDFTHIIHGATTSAHETFQNEPPLRKFNTVALGSRRILEFAEHCRLQEFWLISSGSAYGKQPSDLQLLSEDNLLAPDSMDPNSALGQGKHFAEFLCSLYSCQNNVNIKTARCFTFHGPYLPLNIHYAIGNFISDGLSQRPIFVKGSGTPIRSYLYMADLVIWLLTIFIRGQNRRIYNIGSENGISIAQLARTVAKCFGENYPVHFAQNPTASPLTASADRYIPSTQRAQRELGLKEYISLEDGLKRTIQFYRQQR